MTADIVAPLPSLFFRKALQQVIIFFKLFLSKSFLSLRRPKILVFVHTCDATMT